MREQNIFLLCVAWYLFPYYGLLMCVTSTEASAINFTNNSPFSVMWHSPTWECEETLDVPLDLSKYGIIANSHETWQGDKITLFNKKFGVYPYVLDNGEVVNGGIPQLVNLTSHLEKVANDVIALIPNAKFDGLAVIDWEPWRPIWERNFDAKMIYQNMSLDLVRRSHPEWSDELVHIVAKTEFETAAKMMMEGTLKLAKGLRPHAKWGFYEFPACYNRRDESECSDKVKRDNNELQWLFDASTALYPSIYLSDKRDTAQSFVYGTLNEARRVASRSPTPHIPIYPYSRYNYSNTGFYLTDVDLRNTIGQAMQLGSAGVVLWGDHNDGNNRNACHSLLNYLDGMLGPYVDDVIKQAMTCSEAVCSNHGRCVKRNTGYQGIHLSSILGRRKLLNKVAAYDVITEIDSLLQSYFGYKKVIYNCDCYTGWHGEHCDVEGN